MDAAATKTEKISNDRAKEIFYDLIKTLEDANLTIDETLLFFSWLTEMMLLGVSVNSANEFTQGGGDRLNAPKVGLVTVERYRRMIGGVCAKTQKRFIEGMLAMGLKVVIDESGVIEVTDVRGKEN